MSAPEFAGPGILVALHGEGKCIAGRVVPPGRPVALPAGGRLLVAGMGGEAAAHGARTLLEDGVSGLVVTGFAAGLAPSLGSSVVIVADLVSDDTRDFRCDPAWSGHLRALAGPARRGHLRTVSEPLLTAAAKAAAHARSGALAADMESAAVAACATDAGAPWAALRVVLDPADFALPRCALATDGYGQPRARAFAAALARTPADWPALVRLLRHYRAAARSLRAFGRALATDRRAWP